MRVSQNLGWGHRSPGTHPCLCPTASPGQLCPHSGHAEQGMPIPTMLCPTAGQREGLGAAPSALPSPRSPEERVVLHAAEEGDRPAPGGLPASALQHGALPEVGDPGAEGPEVQGVRCPQPARDVAVQERAGWWHCPGTRSEPHGNPTSHLLKFLSTVFFFWPVFLVRTKPPQAVFAQADTCCMSVPGSVMPFVLRCDRSAECLSQTGQDGLEGVGASSRWAGQRRDARLEVLGASTVAVGRASTSVPLICSSSRWASASA